MQSRRWGLIAVAALIVAAVLLGANLLWKRGAGSSLATATPEDKADLTPSPSPTVTSGPKPLTYTVKGGDTLSAIAQSHDVSLEALTAANDLADPDVLQIGQVLVIPSTDEPALATSPSPDTSAPPSVDEEGEMAVPPTLTRSGPPLVEIAAVEGLGILPEERLILGNQGGIVGLDGWTLSGPGDDPFIFPALTLFPETQVRVHSTEGEDTPRDLFWGRTEPAWHEGELVTLRDSDGNVVDTYIVPE